MKLEFSQQIFEKYSNIKFYENPSTGRRVVPCGRTDRQLFHADGQTDMTKLTVGFSRFCERAQRWHNPLPNIRAVFRQWSASVAGFESRRLMQPSTAIPYYGHVKAHSLETALGTK